MLKFVFCFIFFLIFKIFYASANVLELDNSFLENEKNGKWLVMFYAPWCGHCRSLEPTWMDVGSTFHQLKSDVTVAKLDATEHSDIASHYGIRGFPTIKFIKDGEHFDYNGARSKSDIMAFVNRASGPSITEISTVAALAQVKLNQDVFFLYVGSNDEPLYEMYVATTKELYTTISFYSTSERILPKDSSIKGNPTILVFKDDKFYELPDDLPDAEFLKLWILAEQFQSYNELSAMTYHLLRASGRRFAIAAMKPKDPFNSTFEDIAIGRTHPYMFCWVLGNGIVNRMTTIDVPIPNVIVYDPQSHEYFVMVNETDSRSLTKESVEEFFQDIKDGTIAPRGGSGVGNQIKRFITDTLAFFINFFSSSPLTATAVVVVPTVLIAGLCVCLCTMSDEEEEVPEEDEDASDEGDPKEEDSEEYKDEEDFETIENDPMAKGDVEETGVRRRVKDQEESSQN